MLKNKTKTITTHSCKVTCHLEKKKKHCNPVQVLANVFSRLSYGHSKINADNSSVFTQFGREAKINCSQNVSILDRNNAL